MSEIRITIEIDVDKDNFNHLSKSDQMLLLAHELDKIEFDYEGSRGSALKKVFRGYPIE